MNSVLNKNYQKIVKIQAIIAQAKINNQLNKVNRQLESLNPNLYKHLISYMLNEIKEEDDIIEEKVP